MLKVARMPPAALFVPAAKKGPSHPGCEGNVILVAGFGRGADSRRHACAAQPARMTVAQQVVRAARVTAFRRRELRGVCVERQTPAQIARGVLVLHARRPVFLGIQTVVKPNRGSGELAALYAARFRALL